MLVEIEYLKAYIKTKNALQIQREKSLLDSI